MSSSVSPCAACKFLRRKCGQVRVVAPYFPPDQRQKFANIHKVFGASNITKLLNDLSPVQREDAVISLAYEADARLRDPVYGYVGLISILQHELKQVQLDLLSAKKELAYYVGPSAMLPILQQQQFNKVFDMSGQVTGSGFDQAMAGGSTMSLALGSYEHPYNDQIQEQQPEEPNIYHGQFLQIQQQLLFHQQQHHNVKPQVVSQKLPQHREGHE